MSKIMQVTIPMTDQEKVKRYDALVVFARKRFDSSSAGRANFQAHAYAEILLQLGQDVECPCEVCVDVRVMYALACEQTGAGR